MSTLNKPSPCTDVQYIHNTVARRLERLSTYGETYTQKEWIEYLKDLNDTLENVQDLCEHEHVNEYTHDDCYSSGAMDEIIESYTKPLQAKIDQLLKEKKAPHSRSKNRKSKAQLETELSDALADIEVYKQRLEQGVTAARLAEDFIFTPEEARESFRVINGGAS